MNEAVLERLGIQYSDVGSEYRLDCPYCGKQGHLYLNKASEAFKCHHCQEAGGWSKLRKEYGYNPSITEPLAKTYIYPSEEYVIQCQKRLSSQYGVAAMVYLESRKITSKLALQMKIGLDKKDGNFVLCIPIYENGKPVNIKYRSIPPQEKSFIRWKDGKTALFNGDVLKEANQGEPVFITEGEIDAISLMALGYDKTVGATGGAGTIQTDWIEKLSKFQKIYIVYDNDKEGEKGAEKLAKRLGSEKCWRVKLPVKDANQFIQEGHTAEEFDQCIKESEQYGVENVCTTSQAFAELSREYDRKDDGTAICPHWATVKKLTGSFDPGDLVVLSAKEKTGKTTFALNMAVRWAQQGHPVLFYCLEMRPARLLRQSIKYVMRKTDEELDPKALVDGFRRLADLPLYWGYNYKKVSADIVFETMREAWKRYGIEAIVFDNLHYLARDIKHQTQEVGYITRTLKLLAEELELPIILIAQPRKIGRDDVMGIEDLKDSSSIGADADHVIILYREKTDRNKGADSAFKPETLVRVDASRFHSGGETVIYYDGARSNFTELERRR